MAESLRARRLPVLGDPGSCEAGELARLVRGNDPEALERLNRCLGDRLAAAAARACRDPENARDAVQDTWVAAGTRLDTYRGDGSVEGWLTRMVVNACRGMRRGRKNDPELHLRDAEPAAPGDGAELEVDRGRIAATLTRALAALSPEDQAIVLLAETEDWRSPEIAAELGISPGAVRTRLSRARARLRALLA